MVFLVTGDARELPRLMRSSERAMRGDKLSILGTKRFLSALEDGGLPESITEITLTDCWELNEWPTTARLPTGLRRLSIRGSRLRVPPNLTECKVLEEVDMQDNHLDPFRGRDMMPLPWLPESVRTVNLKLNRICHIEDWEAVFPAHVVSIDVSYNILTTSTGPSMEFLQKRPGRVAYHHNRIGKDDLWLQTLTPYEQQRHAQNAAAYTGAQTVHATAAAAAYTGAQTVHAAYTGAQTVHNISVQSGARDAVERIQALTKGWKLLKGDDLVSAVVKLRTRRVRGAWFGWRWLAEMVDAALDPGDDEDIKIDREALSKAVKSTTGSYCGLTYGELLSRVLAFIETHDHARDLHRRLQEEINDGHAMCFTGQSTRLLNALQGFVDGIHIGVSVREGMNARIDRLFLKCEKEASREATVALRNELVEALEDGECDSGEMDAWCSAFDGLVDNRFGPGPT